MKTSMINGTPIRVSILWPFKLSYWVQKQYKYIVLWIVKDYGFTIDDNTGFILYKTKLIPYIMEKIPKNYIQLIESRVCKLWES